ncbi:MAG: 50S ribosomal protein L4 [Bacteroidota bacterium]
MQVNVLSINGESTGRSVELPEEIFGVEPNEHVIYLAVKTYLANQRQGTHKSKERGEITGSTRKLKRQKGTGTARAGSIKSPVFRGGGRVFGPKPRNYTLRLNKKTKQLARKVALSDKLRNEDLIIVEDFSFDAPKTKEYINILSALEANGRKSLLLTSDYEKEIYLSSRNLKGAEVNVSSDVNTYQILNADKLIVSEGAIAKLTEIL